MQALFTHHDMAIFALATAGMEGRLSGWRDPEPEQERAEVWERGTELRQRQIMES